MFCPSCGKAIPENSTFCLHCGTRILAPTGTAPVQVVEWESDEFCYWWDHKKWYVAVSNSWTEVTARNEIWANYQREITTELQKWLDDGWQPLGEIGPAAIETKRFDEWFTTYIEPTVFRVKMRRPAIPGREKQKTAFDVVLVSFPAGQKIPIIQIIRQLIPGLSLKEAKDMVETPNAVILRGMSKTEARNAKRRLEAVRASVELR